MDFLGSGKGKGMDLPKTIYDIRSQHWESWIMDPYKLCKGFGCFILVYYLFVFFYFMNYSKIEMVFCCLIIIFIVYLWYFMIKYRNNKKRIDRMKMEIKLDVENQIS